jgi:8-oxo-dGTP pyrophosphatase MutT (NUDIX family)
MTMISLLLIVNNNRYLLFKRRENQLYALPGGHVEEGETPLDAIIREIGEELSIVLPNVKLIGRYPHNDKVLNVYYYNNTEFDPSSIILDEEHDDYRWFTYYEVLNSKDTMKNITTFINDYLTNGNI